MLTPTNAAPTIETRPVTQPIPVETFPNNPNDPLGVRREIIEEIEKIPKVSAFGLPDVAAPGAALVPAMSHEAVVLH